ncbi:MAG: glycerol-3-phosphate 1-O-acyltransferase PlsY [Alphaproteobacteria bacterium]|nr:glycerol-3-phosphate 1-O-acyltransferase PlsY [Alphaproteobacteria bacterium]
MIYSLLILSYLLGSIPFGLVLTRYFLGIDVRTMGSGNIGTTNVLRTGNKKIAIATLLLDTLKGTIAVGLALILSKDPLIIYGCALMSLLGHIFPVWLRFKGGKGVATALGVFLALNPMLFLCIAATWLISAKVFKISSLSALIAFALSPLYAYFITNDAFRYEPMTYDPWLTPFSCIIVVLLLTTHRVNIVRLLKGVEGKIGKR